MKKPKGQLLIGQNSCNFFNTEKLKKIKHKKLLLVRNYDIKHLKFRFKFMSRELFKEKRKWVS